MKNKNLQLDGDLGSNNSDTVLEESDYRQMDLALIKLNLSLSYEDRIRRHDEAARLVEDLENVREKLRDAKPW